MLAFALVIIVDYYLPQVEYREVAESGWQRRLGARKSSKPRRTGSRGELVSYMKTKHFIIAVPDEIHIDYDYYATNKKVLTIAVSPIFNIPSTLSLEKDGLYYTVDIERTIFSNRGKVHFLLFIFSLFIVLRKDYSELNFCISIIPPLLLIYILAVMF